MVPYGPRKLRQEPFVFFSRFLRAGQSGFGHTRYGRLEVFRHNPAAYYRPPVKVTHHKTAA